MADNLTTQRASVNGVARMPWSVGSHDRTARPIHRQGAATTQKERKARVHAFTDWVLLLVLSLSGECPALLFSQSGFHLGGCVFLHHNVLLEKPVTRFFEVNGVLAGIHSGNGGRGDASRLRLAGPAFIHGH